MAIVKLKTYGFVFEATLVKGRLENEGIPCFLTNENFSSLMPHYINMPGSGVHLYVEKSYDDKAISLIHNIEILNPIIFLFLYLTRQKTAKPFLPV